ncbi:MAG: polyprenyl diphosphate synthase [Patescibacteria group bacterium]
MNSKDIIVPNHIGIIIDGNRRWAKAHNLPTLEGHRVGSDKVKEIAEYALAKGVKILTIFAFSTENWKRSEEEVNYLFKLFSTFLDKETNNLAEKGIKLQILGDKTRFSTDLQRAIANSEEKTTEVKKGILNLCVNYGGRDEIINAVKNIIKNKIPASEITEELFSKNLYTSNLPDPDFIIRTSGEQRLSGFLTWQSVYSELYFVKKMWPEFTKDDFDEALLEFSNRQRRFGGG